MPDHDSEIQAPFDPGHYWQERLEREYSLAGVGWLGLSESFNRWMYAVRRSVFSRAVRGLFDPRKARVLDVGSGTGFYVERWKELGARDITGCDLTAVAVERLRERFPEAQFQQLDISAGSLELDGPYDAVSAMDVLYHIVDDERYAQALRNLAGLVAPGGYLVLTENLLHGEALRTSHQVSRSFDAIVRLLNDGGLEIVRRRPVFVLMNTPVDTNNGFLKFLFPRVQLVARRKNTGWLAGAALYPAELVLTRLLREGPSTEIVVCRKADAAP
jgi:2-polyprenyl-3-methyl-5-hydroxy-6-metoxy-1,4-benzoquinol methylase